MSKFGLHRHAHHLKRSRTKKVAPILKKIARLLLFLVFSCISSLCHAFLLTEISITPLNLPSHRTSFSKSTFLVYVREAQIRRPILDALSGK